MKMFTNLDKKTSERLFVTCSLFVNNVIYEGGGNIFVTL